MNHQNHEDITWINPIGGLGDTLMVSGVLKLVNEQYPEKRFNLVRRTNYLSILDGHPAIAKVGFPLKGAKIIATDYWSDPEFSSKKIRAFQVLAKRFGLQIPVEEKLYLAKEEELEPILGNIIPWGKKNIVIAPSSASPRKEMHPFHWQTLVEKLISEDFLVIQIGKLTDVYIRKTYSLLGITSPRQLIALIKKCDLVITSDNFAMHVAHFTGTPAIVLWGPTEESIYGYPEQSHLRASPLCKKIEDCIVPELNTYVRPCDFTPEDHCMNRILMDEIYAISVEQLAK